MNQRRVAEEKICNIKLQNSKICKINLHHYLENICDKINKCIIRKKRYVKCNYKIQKYVRSTYTII